MRRTASRNLALVVCLISLVFAACGRDDSPTVEAEAKPTPIKLQSVENAGAYAFNLDGVSSYTVDSLASIELDNRDAKEAHQAAMVRLADGKTVDDVKAFLAGAESGAAPSGPPPFTVGGGTTAVDPGGSVTVTQALPAGTYAFFCFVPGPDGAPHFAKGMAATITVNGNSTSSLPLPDGENSTTTEYKYELPTLKEGSVTLRTRNAGQQDHEYQFGLVAAGKTADDAKNWLANPQGPPPMSFIGGPVIGRGGGANSFRLTLKQGTYVVYCNIPDDADGRPHSAHGMFQSVEIK